jgi:starch-binding outer membrane protein, SusD/RagB family
MADDALQRLEGYSDTEVPDRTQLMGRAALYAGYSYAAFGEAFCEAAFDLGPALAPPEIFQLAEDRFTTAIQMAGAANDATTRDAAYVGRARVRLPLGKMEEAAADARMVPVGFEFHVTRSNAHARRQNSIHMQNGRGTSVTVDPNYWVTTWEGVPDPRIPVADANRTAVDIMNELHAAVGIPEFSSTDPEEIRAQVIEERRREFFLEGHRMGDLRRVGGFSDWNRAGTVNEWTLFEFGGTECFPLPDVERRNNPNIP